MMNYLQQNQASLNPQQNTLLQQLQHQYRLMTQNQKQQGAKPQGNVECFNNSQEPSGLTEFSSIPHQNVAHQTIPTSNSAACTQSNATTQSKLIPSSNIKTENSYFGEKELQALLYQKQSTSSVSEGLISEFGLKSKIKLDLKDSESSQSATANTNSALAASDKQTLTSINSDSSTHIISNKIDKKSSSSHCAHSLQLSIDMPAALVYETCKRTAGSGNIKSNILSDDGKPPIPPDPPYPPLPREKLLPPTPSVFVSFCQ